MGLQQLGLRPCCGQSTTTVVRITLGGAKTGKDTELRAGLGPVYYLSVERLGGV